MQNVCYHLLYQYTETRKKCFWLRKTRMKMNCNLKTLTNFFKFFPCRSLSESLGIPSVLSLGALGKCLVSEALWQFCKRNKTRVSVSSKVKNFCIILYTANIENLILRFKNSRKYGNLLQMFPRRSRTPDFGRKFLAKKCASYAGFYGY